MIQIKHEVTGVVLKEVEGDALKGANLYGANLYGANLSRADLSGAKGVITFCFEQHLAIAYSLESKTYLKIGCENHELSHWKENFRQIGAKNGYTEAQIDQYGALIQVIKEFK